MTALEAIEALPVSMRHPAWRWNASLLVVADRNIRPQEEANMSVLDHYVGRAIKFCREKQDPRTGSRMYKERYPDIYEAYLLNMCDNPNGGYKWQIEAMLMTDASLEDIADNYLLENGVDTIRAYARLFFDIEPYREKGLCVLGNVLSSSLASNRGIDDYDYSWKAFAYEKGYDNLLKFLKFKAGSRLPKVLKKWFDEMTQDRVTYGAYAASANLRNMYNNQAIQVLDVASRYYTVSNSIANKLNSGDEEAVLAAKQILGALQEVILNPNIEKQIADNNDPHEPIMFTPVETVQE
jgi:hypothetical protein